MEDNEGDVELVRQSLAERVSDRLHVLSRGNEVIPFLDSVPNTLPGLIILDYHLPGMSGIEVIRAVKSYEQFRSIPVVMIASVDDAMDIAGVWKAGANGVVDKPVDVREHLKLLNQVFTFFLDVVIFS